MPYTSLVENFLLQMQMTLPECGSPDYRYMAPLAGAMTAATGLNQTFPLPAYVHEALAGAATDVYCSGSVEPNSQLAMCAVGGVMGAEIYKSFGWLGLGLTVFAVRSVMVAA